MRNTSNQVIGYPPARSVGVLIGPMFLAMAMLCIVLAGLARPTVAQAQSTGETSVAQVRGSSKPETPRAAASSWTINSTADAIDAAPGDGACETAVGNQVCTLRAAIQEANALAGDDILQLPAGIYQLTLGGVNEDNAATGDLDIRSNLAIVGSGAATTIIDGNSLDRVFHVVSTSTITVSNITVRGGNPGDYQSGGGIYNHYGVLAVSDSIIASGQTIYGWGAGIMNDHGQLTVLRSTLTANLGNAGAIANSAGAILTVTDSLFSGNYSGWGGAISNDSGGIAQITNSTMTGNSAMYGEGVHNLGTMALSHVSISNNVHKAVSGAGLYNEGNLTIRDSLISGNGASWGGGVINKGWMLVAYTTVSGNSASASGGGIYNSGTLNVVNSTISDNNAKWGGGLFNAGSEATFNNVTIAYNTASTTGGGITVNSGQVTLGNSILAQHLSPSGSPDCSGTLTSAGYNLIESVTGCSITGTLTGNQLGVNPQLGLLQDNGGPTLTRSLLNGSPAIDAGDPAVPGSGNGACEGFDQRGAVRPADGDGNGTARCDIGAYERTPPPEVQFAHSDFAIGEHAGIASLTVTLSAPSVLTVTATYTGAGLTALPGSDYLVPGNTVIFTPGEVNTSFDVVILDDAQAEPAETLVLTLTAASNAVVGAPNSATLTILDNDSGPITDLTAINSGPTQTGSSTFFTATIATGKSPTYTWDFGDGTLGSGAVVTHTYLAVGTYTASVTADNSINSVTATTPVTVVDVPIVGLMAISESPTVLGHSTMLTASIVGGTNVSYSWNFGDGVAAAGSPVVHTYDSSGTYTAMVIATNSAGGVTATTRVTITNLAPIAIAGADQSMTVNSTVTLDGSASTDPDGHLPLAYRWTQTGGPSVLLGNSAVSVTTFSAPSSFAVLTFTLTVTDAYRLSGLSDPIVITVTDEPVTGLSAVNSGPTTLGHVTWFTATAQGTHISYTWMFGDGIAASGNPISYTYATQGSYMATVTAANGANSLTVTSPVTITNLAPVAVAGSDQAVFVSSQVELDGSDSYDQDGHLPLIYQWTQTGGPSVVLGNSALSVTTFATPSSVAVLTFTLAVTDAYGLSGLSDTIVVTGADVPIAGLSAVSSSPTTLGRVTWFTATADGSNIVYTWDLGDGATAVGQTTPYTYGLSGTYTAVVTAINGRGSVVATTPVTITNLAPFANAGPDQAIAATTLIRLDGSVSTDPDGHLPLSYEWQQTSGRPVVLSSRVISQPIFTAPNAPSILAFSLIVTDSMGLRSPLSATVVITVSDQLLSSLLAVSSNPTTLGQPTWFTATAAGTNIVYTWNCGDGVLVSGNSISHTYATTGFYTAIVTAENNTSFLSQTLPVTITNLSPVAVAGPDLAVFVDSQVELDGSDSYDQDGHVPLTYQWMQIGGPAVLLDSTVISRPIFAAPAVPAVLTFTLSVTDAYGMPGVTDAVVISATDQAIAGFIPSASGPVRVGIPVSFSAQISAGTNVSYEWNFGDEVTEGPTNLTTTHHVYQTYGQFTAVVTATNSVNSSMKTLSVAIMPYQIYLPLMTKNP